MSAPVRVSLFGPCEVRTDGRVRSVAGVKLQSLLAMLALAASQVVSDDRLIDELWGDTQPGNPANALQALVSHLRRLLGRDVLIRQGTGYVLSLDPDLIDTTRVERLVQQGREAAACGDHGAAVDLFRSAVGLIRGPPLGDLLDSWFARDARTRLHELVVAAHEGLVDGELSIGRHADVLASVVDLVSRYPLREHFRTQLIVALYRSGRQAEALQAYRDAREYLLDEMGLDPGPELQGLEHAILAQDSALATPIALVPSTPRRPDLPANLTSFVGRRQELATLDGALASSRLTSIVGPGGVGKTRLALELVRDLADQDEVWFVELEPVLQLSAVAEAVAAGVGAHEQLPVDGRTPATPVQRAVDRLADRGAIVVLDGCEHVASAVAHCALALLTGCGQLRIVATSREPLRIDGECQILVGAMNDDDSVELFVERARGVQPHFTAAGHEAVELVGLCRHLDGLPLAIELAAARTKTLPLPELVDRLHDRFRLLRRTQDTGMSRHTSLEATIDWSYDLLFEEEQRTFRALAVFAGGATIDAAERICGRDAFDVVSRLVDRSLLVADTTGPSVRFTALESVRAYGMERLAEHNELGAARAAHLRWCIELAERVDREVRGHDQLQWLTRLDEEHDNIRAALGYAVEHDPDGALQLVGAVILPWWFRGRRQETRQWCEACLAAGGVDASPRLRARVLSTGGLFAEPTSPPLAVDGDELHHELAIAEARQREALALCLAGDDERDIASSRLLLLATLARRASTGEPVDRTEAAELAAMGTAGFDRLCDDFGSGVTRVTDAILAVVFGEPDRAAAIAQAAQQYARRSGDRFSASRIAYVLGMIADLRGDVHVAYRHIMTSLRLLDELGIDQAVTAQARLLVPLAVRCGEPELASRWRAFVGGRRDGWTHYDGAVLAAARNREGLAARAAGDLQRAADVHTNALVWYSSAGMPTGIAMTESCLGFLAAERGDAAGATRHHAAALEAATTVDDAAALALALEGCATEIDEPRDTAALLGSARRLWAGVPASHEPTHRDDVAVSGDAAHDVLGEDGWIAALAIGASLERHQVIAIARRGVLRDRV